MRSIDSRLLQVRRVYRSVSPGSQAHAWAARPSGSQAWSRHPIDLRASVPLPNGRWYVTIVAGPERRSADRLRAEGQTNWLRRTAVYVMLMSLALWCAVCLIVGTYLIKSALGLELFEGGSPLHFLYERWLES